MFPTMVVSRITFPFLPFVSPPCLASATHNCCLHSPSPRWFTATGNFVAQGLRAKSIQGPDPASDKLPDKTGEARGKTIYRLFNYTK